MLYFLTEHTLIIHVQNIKGSKRKTSYLLEKLSEKDYVHFVSDSILNAKNLLTHHQRMFQNRKIKNCFFFMTAYSWRSD